MGDPPEGGAGRHSWVTRGGQWKGIEAGAYVHLTMLHPSPPDLLPDVGAGACLTPMASRGSRRTAWSSMGLNSQRCGHKSVVTKV